MKIAFFHNLPPGGALRCLYDKIKYLEKSGDQVSLYTFSTADTSFLKVPSISGDHYIQPLLFKGISRFFNYSEATRKLAERLNRSDCDFIIVDKCRFTGSPPLTQWLRKSYIYYAHEPLRIWEYENQLKEHMSIEESVSKKLSKTTLKAMLSFPWRYRERLWMKRQDWMGMQNASKVATNSEFTSQWIERVYGKKPVVLYQGIDPEIFYPEKDVLKENSLVSVGRMDKVKSHDFILRVLARIPADSRPKWHIVSDTIDGQYFSEFKKSATRLNVPFELHHNINDSQLRNIYSRSLITLCASRNEPFGLVPIESMACETPVIAMNEGGFRETISHNKTGYLLDRNEEVWGKQILYLLSNREDLNRLSSAGKQVIAEKWRWSQFFDRLKQHMLNHENVDIENKT